MKRLFLAAALTMAAAVAQADPVEGVWQTQVDDGAFAHVRIAACGTKICGTIARTFRDGAEYRSDNVGRQLVWDMVPSGNGAYRDGQIWQPSTDKVYRSKMDLSGDTLRVSGCVGPICKKQTWARVR